MKDWSQAFIWSDGWWVEGDKAWFVDGMCNELFCVDLTTEECEKVACIPGLEEQKYRQNSYCAKSGSDIYCIPGQGESVWIYNLDDNAFTELKMDRPKQHAPGSQFWIWNDRVIVVPANWNKIVEISISQRKIINYYTICKNDSVMRSILVKDMIYAVSVISGTIYQFDLSTKKVERYLHSDMAEKIFAICYSGGKFFLCGYQEEMYVWDDKKDSFTTISFPENLEIDNTDKQVESTEDIPLFEIVSVGEYIWLIPIRAKNIIYVNRKTGVVSAFEVNKGDKTNISTSLQKYQAIPDYKFQYVRDDRYIGVFSARNRRIMEIDTIQLIHQWKGYHFSERYIMKYYKDTYYEGKDPLSIYAYRMGKQASCYKVSKINYAGEKIHTMLAKERI